MDLVNLEFVVLQRAVLYRPVLQCTLCSNDGWRFFQRKQDRCLAIGGDVEVGWTIRIRRIGQHLREVDLAMRSGSRSAQRGEAGTRIRRAVNVRY